MLVAHAAGGSGWRGDTSLIDVTEMLADNMPAAL